MLAILQLIAECLKIVLMIVGAINKFKGEEREMYLQRLELVVAILKKATAGVFDVFDEKGYLSNLQWEEQERYNAYKNAAYANLILGEGIDSLMLNTVMGMGLRITANEKEVIAILNKPILPDEKAQLIAKLLSTQMA